MAPAKVTVELVGPTMERDTADPLLVLGFATAYFKALQLVAEKRLGEDLQLQGLWIEDKCIATVSTGRADVLPPAIVKLAAAMHDPEERDELIRAVARGSRNLPKGVEAFVLLDGLPRFPITGVEPARGSLVEIADFQGYVIRVGGVPASVDLHDQTTNSRVILRGAQDEIKQLSRHLYELVDVIAEVSTDQLTGKRTGSLIAFHPVPEIDPIAAWRTWFAENAKEWNDVDDIEAELDQ